MSFMQTQRIITLVSRLAFFFILFFSFAAAHLPPLLFLSEYGTAALLALLVSIPIGHASSFWYMTTSNLTFLSFVYAIADLIISRFGWYDVWRKFTLRGWLPFVLCAIYILTGLIVAKNIRKTRYPISTAHSLPGSHLRIIQLSDIHPWRFQTKREIARLYRMIDEENPDIIVLTGDIFDENTTVKMFRRYIDLFAALHPKYGIYYVFGNHDTSSHWKQPSHSRDDILREFDAVGITILEDELIDAANGMVRIIGRRDLDEERLSPDELFEKQKAFDGFQILLCHEPVELRKCADAGADLILAGHTHGGQIFPVGLVTEHILKMNEANTGKTPLNDTANAIISSGVGTWSYPIRTESRSEIVIIDVYSDAS